MGYYANEPSRSKPFAGAPRLEGCGVLDLRPGIQLLKYWMLWWLGGHGLSSV